MTESSFVEQSKVHLKEGDIAFKKGEMAEVMFVVMSGRVRLYLADRASGAWSEELFKGDFFGEGSLLEALPREATAVAMEDTELISISRGTFMRMIRQNPEISVKMMQKLARRNRELSARMEIWDEDATAAGLAGLSGITMKLEQSRQRAFFISVVSGKRYSVDSHGTLIGRFDPKTKIYPDIDLTGDDTYLSVSRRHARILVEHDRYFVSEENGVVNGTFVQGERLALGEVQEIRDGDRIGFGAVSLVFHTEP